MVKNLFSYCSVEYTKYRPCYPRELFRYLASLAPSQQCAWDVACGTGQATLELTHYFDQIIATDISKEQIENATAHPKIIFKISRAEKTDIANESIDLITIAQAIHWLEFDLFYTNAKRVLKDNGIIAFWMYNLCRVEPGIDQVIQKYYDILRPYWPKERRWIEINYQGIPFPFEEITHEKEFVMKTEWNMEELMGYLETWSAAQKYKLEHESSPLLLVSKELKEKWGNTNKRPINWPLTLRVGRHVHIRN